MLDKILAGNLSGWKDFNPHTTNVTGESIFIARYIVKNKVVKFVVLADSTISNAATQASFLLPVEPYSQFYSQIFGYVTDNGSSMSVSFGINDNSVSFPAYSCAIYHTLSGNGNSFEYGVAGFYEAA